MFSDLSPMTSPENVACYEECVTDEPYLPSPLPASSRHDVPRSLSSGRISKKARTRPRALKERKCSSPMVLKWLEENYETVSGACLPRSVLYTHYQDFCKRNHVEPSSAASFGKIIRVKFPNLTTRRLGTRGQSKYHYYGLAIKETSVYYRSVYSKKGLTRFSGASVKRENGQPYNPSSKTGILLPEFPKLSDLSFTKPFPVDKIETLLLMYRAHCQRILDSVVRANFHEVQDFLIHFWQGMPTHMLPILGCQATVDLIVVCDFIVYRTLSEVLVPATLQPLPDNLVDEIVSFSHSLVEWLFAALQDQPAALGIRKVQTGEMFGKSLRRQTALVQLAKGARGVLRNSELVTRLLNDWRCLDLEGMSEQVGISQLMGESAGDLLKEFSSELEQLFVKQSSLEVYFEWLDSLIERRVSEPAEKGLSLVELSQEFLLTWNYFYTSVEKEMAAIKGTSFDSFRTLHLVLDEYVNYVIELLQSGMVEQQYNAVLKVHGSIDGDTSSAGAPPPFLPPTPDHTPKINSDRFFTSFESPITAEIQNSSPIFTSGLTSPSFSTFNDSFCDGFFKQELPAYRPSCSHAPTTLPLDHRETISSFLENTPLTPQSSYHSTSSPLSHSSIHSPEPSSDLEFGSLNSCSPHGSPAIPISSVNSGIFTSSATPIHSSCPTPDEHATALDDITASLGLVTEVYVPNIPISGASPSAYDLIMPDVSSPYHACGPQGMTLSTPGSHHLYGQPQHGSSYPHYDFELHHLMSNPDDLLTDPFCNPKEVKSFLQSPSPATPILNH